MSIQYLSQVWVGTIALGPNGTSLNAAYKNAEVSDLYLWITTSIIFMLMTAVHSNVVKY